MIAAGLLLRAGHVESADCEDGWRERWDSGEADILRTTILPELTGLADYSHVEEVFELAMSGDEAASAPLMDLVGHTDEDVAASAASALGRFPSAEAAVRLKSAFNEDSRSWVRMGALYGLLRMNDAETGALAVQALSQPNLQLQAAAVSVLVRLRDSQYGPALFSFYESHRDERHLLESVGCLGDPPGSTVVRDGLLAEANNKSYDFAVRLAAADGLEEMGYGDLVKGLLDRDKGNPSYQSLEVVEFAVVELAASRNVVIKGQAEADILLGDADLGRDRLDMWHHPIRVHFVEEGVVRATSDGPDGLPNTEDDLSTDESYRAWAYRVFPDQYE